MAKDPQSFDAAVKSGQASRVDRGLSPTPVNSPGSRSEDRVSKAMESIKDYHVPPAAPAPRVAPAPSGPPRSLRANGHILDNIELVHAGTHYSEPKLMFRNTGRGVFENVSDKLGPHFVAPRVSRAWLWETSTMTAISTSWWATMP